MFKLEELIQSGHYPQKKVKKPIPQMNGYERCPIIPRENWHHFSILQDTINYQTGPWIAGGSVLSWYTGKAVDYGDIDVFCASKEQALDLCKKLEDYGLYDRFNCSTTSNFVDPNSSLTELKIQVVKSKFFHSVDHLLDSFDLTICKIATDGRTFYVNDSRFYEHVKEKKMWFDVINSQTLKRLVKYRAMGYTLPKVQAEQILNSVDFDSHMKNPNMGIDDYETIG